MAEAAENLSGAGRGRADLKQGADLTVAKDVA
jgi:hypothetical protein